MIFSEFFLAPQHHTHEGDVACSPVGNVRARVARAADGASGFPIDLRFPLPDGNFGNVQLTPFEAAALMSEIARAIDRGNRRQRRTPASLRNMQNCYDG